MFTGIIQDKRPVVELIEKKDLVTLKLDLTPAQCEGLQPGASIAVNGVCLTVTDIDNAVVSFDIMIETLRVTNLKFLQVGNLVNMERAARFGDEIGGHPLSGHIHDMVEIESIERPENNCIITFRFDSQWHDYLQPKGYVALNGASLTIGDAVEDGRFCVYLIPETLAITTFGQAKAGDRVNLEIDSQTQAIVNTVRRMMARNQT